MNTDVSSVVYLTELIRESRSFTLGFSEVLAEIFDGEILWTLVPDNSGVTKPGYVVRGSSTCFVRVLLCRVS